MHVFIIADFAVADGGAPEVAIVSAVALANKGVRVTYVHGVGIDGDPRLDNHPLIERIGLGEQDVWGKNFLSGVKDGVWNREYQGRLQEIFANRATAGSIIHIHQWTKYFSPSVFECSLNSGMPTVVSMHDYFLSCPTGLMYRFDTKSMCELKPMSVGCTLAQCDPRSPLHKIVRITRRLAVSKALSSGRLAVVHVSERGRETISRHLPKHTTEFVLDNPVELEDAGPRELTGEGKLVYCGRLTEEKGVIVAARAAREAGLPIKFIGEGPARAAILECNPSAEITGWVERPQALEIIRSEALAVLALSLWPETGPLVVAEALAAGVPAIVSERAGAVSRICDSLNGFSVSPDVDSIVPILQALGDSDRAKQLGLQAYEEFWRDPPTPQAHAVKLIDVYKQLETGRVSATV